MKISPYAITSKWLPRSSYLSPPPPQRYIYFWLYDQVGFPLCIWWMTGCIAVWVHLELRALATRHSLCHRRTPLVRLIHLPPHSPQFQAPFVLCSTLTSSIFLFAFIIYNNVPKLDRSPRPIHLALWVWSLGASPVFGCIRALRGPLLITHHTINSPRGQWDDIKSPIYFNHLKSSK